MQQSLRLRVVARDFRTFRMAHLDPRFAAATGPSYARRDGVHPGRPGPNISRRMNHEPKLPRHLLRTRDRVDAVPHEDWRGWRLAEVIAISPARFIRAFGWALLPSRLPGLADRACRNAVRFTSTQH